MLRHLLCEGNGGQDIDTKLFVAPERIVCDGQRLSIGRRSKRTRKQQAAPFTIFNRIAEDRCIKGYRVLFGEETDEGEPIGKAAAHDIVGNREMVALSEPGFRKNMMALARARSTWQAWLKPFQSIV